MTVKQSPDGTHHHSISRRALLKAAGVGVAGLSAKASIVGAITGLMASRARASAPDTGPPYFLCDGDGRTSVLSPASYVGRRRTRFPSNHRLAGLQSRNSMEKMQRSLMHLLIRCDYDVDLFLSYLNHGIDEMVIPYVSRHVGMRGGWVYPNGSFHGGLDFNNRPLENYPYRDLPRLTNFDVVAAADGTIVGWDEVKLLTVEHTARSGRRYRTVYNMLRNVPVDDDPGRSVIRLGTPVNQGQVIGETWDPPGNPIHLHFGMFLEHSARPGWAPNTAALFLELTNLFDLDFEDADRDRIIGELDLDPATLEPRTPWPETEWYPVDPFGVYGQSRSSQTDYSLVYNGFYYPVPKGPGTYAFKDPSGDRIPYLAASRPLKQDLSVQALSLATAAALFE